jgi:hypothetical protein
MFVVALSWVAVGVLGEAAGYLTALQPATILLVALLSGHLADRLEPRRLMIAADLARAAVLAGLVVAWLRQGLPPAWALVGTVVALAMGQALFRPALQATIPPLTRDPARLPAANALLDTTERIARLLGPGLIGVLAAVLPVVWFVIIDLATFLASAASVAAILWIRPAGRWPRASRQSVWASLGRGFAAMRSHPVLGFILLVTSGPVVGIWFAVMFLAVPLVLGPTPRGLAGFGLVIAAYGSTNLLATLWFGGLAMPRRAGRMIFGSDILLGGGLAIMGLAALTLPAAWVLPGLCAGAAIGAIGGPMGDIPIAVLRQTRLALADQAPAMRAYMVVSNAGMLIALVGAPGVFRWIGVAPAIVAGSAAMIGFGGLLRHGGTET